MNFSYVSTELAPKAIGPYSQAVTHDGLVYCAGQLPIDPSTGTVIAQGIEEQTLRVIRNLAEVLECAGSGLDCVMRTTVYLTDLRDSGPMNSVYAEQFRAHKPARVTIQVAALPANARVEIDCIASVRR